VQSACPGKWLIASLSARSPLGEIVSEVVVTAGQVRKERIEVAGLRTIVTKRQ
jgi:hypothetical protein